MHLEDLAMVQMHDAVDEDRRDAQIVNAHNESLRHPTRVYVLWTRFSMSFPQSLWRGPFGWGLAQTEASGRRSSILDRISRVAVGSLFPAVRLFNMLALASA
jgi:hypothetical protein